MLLIIPSIELYNGCCKYCIAGDDDIQSYYSNLTINLTSFVKLLRRENTKTIHITDLDSFENNFQNKYKLIELANSVDIPIQLLYNFNSIDECIFFLENGIYRIALSLLAISDYDSVSRLIQKYEKSRIVFSLEVSEGIIEYESMNIKISERDYLIHIHTLGASRIIYYDRSWSSGFECIDFSKIHELSKTYQVKITLKDVVSWASHLWELQKHIQDGIDSVIIGMPLYENKFPCQKIWRIAEKKFDALNPN